MSDTLALDSLEIKNFRAFKHLRIERLARVNLIVGKNNVGKTSLLEAVWLWAEGGTPRAVFQILAERKQFEPDRELNPPENNVSSASQNYIDALKSLFYGRKDIAALGADNDIEITTRKDGLPLRFFMSDLQSLRDERPTYKTTPENTALKVQLGNKAEIYGLTNNRLHQKNGEFFVKAVKVNASGVTNSWMAQVWDRTYLVDTQNSVDTSLRLIEPSVERTGLSVTGSGQRIPFAKLKAIEELVSLASLGEGMNRMFGLALALVNAKDGVLLIDEIDTGLHYSVLTKMWKLVFETARRLNVQVFATTHSKDCIEAFEQAMRQNNFDDGLVIKLHAKEDAPGEIEAIVIDKDILEVAVREDIEVRD